MQGRPAARVEAIPEHPLPPGYHIAWYRPGDERQRHWLAIKACADAYHEADAGYFWETYEAARDQLPLRQAYLYGAGNVPLGTLTAWFEDLGGRRYGKINWMLLLPEAHRSALLYTLTAHVPAINRYQQFGFVHSRPARHHGVGRGEPTAQATLHAGRLPVAGARLHRGGCPMRITLLGTGSPNPLPSALNTLTASGALNDSQRSEVERLVAALVSVTALLP